MEQEFGGQEERKSGDDNWVSQQDWRKLSFCLIEHHAKGKTKNM
jgi:hypothetical protein